MVDVTKISLPATIKLYKKHRRSDHFTYKNSCFAKKYVKTHRGLKFECLWNYDHEVVHKYRVIFNYDDYDYVANKKLIKELDKLFKV